MNHKSSLRQQKSHFWYAIGIIGCVVLVTLIIGGLGIGSSLITQPSPPSPSQPPPSTIECADGNENEDFSCNEAADFDTDFDNLNLSVIVYDTLPWCCNNVTIEIEIAPIADNGGGNEINRPPDLVLESQQLASDAILPYRGVSLAGGEFANGPNNTYAENGNCLPFDNDAALFIHKGMNTFRIPITWEYFADRQGNILPASSNYIDRLDKVINGLISPPRNAFVILELHNYMRYNRNDVSRNVANTDPDGDDVIRPCSDRPVWCSGVAMSSFARLWRNIVARYNAPRMIYGIMNEPHDVAYNNLNEVTRLAFDAIRRAENQTASRHHHLILVSGNQYTGLHSWFNAQPGGTRSNAENGAEAYDLLRERYDANFAVEVHQYFDADSSGNYDTGDCIPFATFKAGFDAYWPPFMNWATVNRHQIFIGEFGVPDTPTCKQNVLYFLDAITRFAYSPSRGSGVIGWTLWTAGNCWGNYILSLAPGGRANGLLQGNLTYEKYLFPVAPIPNIINETRALSIENRANETLKFASGYLPFQFTGSADIAPGATGYLYSNNPTNTPIGDGGLQINFYIRDDKSTVLGFGIETPKDNVRNAYGYSNILGFVTSSYGFPACLIIASGVQHNPGEARCFVVTNN